MEINKENFEAMLILLFKLEEVQACDELLKVYIKIFDVSPEAHEELVH